MASKLQAIADENNKLTQTIAAQGRKIVELQAAPKIDPVLNTRLESLVKENSRLSGVLEQTEAKLIQSELKVQDLVVQQQEVLSRLKRLLSATN
jgi:hypothetical protein